MGSDALYNEQALLWAVIRFVCAVTGMRRTPPVRAEVYAGSTRPRPPYWRGAAWVQAQPAGFSLLSSALAASAACGRTSPLLCAAIWRRSFLWEVGTSYNERRLLWGAVRFVQAVSCVRRIPRRRRELRAGSACGAEEGAGSACRAGQPAFMRAYRIRGARRFLWEVIHSIISGGFHGE